MDKKRLGLIILFCLVCVVLGYAIYRIFFYTAPTTTLLPPGELPAGTDFPEAGEGGIIRPPTTPPGELPAAGEVTPTGAAPTIEEEPRVKQIVDFSIEGSVVDPNGDMKFYNKQNGKFYRYDTAGNVELLSDEVFYNVENVTWSPNKNESIIEYPDGSNIYYNFDSKKQVTLPKHWQEFDFSPTGDKLASKSMGLSPENRWLITSDPEGNNIQTIEPMGNNSNKVVVDWSPTRQVVALSTTGETLGSYRQEVLFVGLHGENFPSIIVEGRGLETEWSTGGEKLLYSVFSPRSEYKPELWIVNADGEDIGSGRRTLNINTWADKCTFQDERFVYCGVPNNLQTGAGFNPSVADNTFDTLYKIDTETGTKTEIRLDEAHSIDEIYIGDKGKSLYFTDKTGDGLYSVEI